MWNFFVRSKGNSRRPIRKQKTAKKPNRKLRKNSGRLYAIYMSIRDRINRNSMRMSGAACAGNFVVGTGKLIIGIISLSLFTCVSAFYTYGMVVAKGCALWGRRYERQKQYAYYNYRLTAIILIVASILYVIYSMRLLWRPEHTSYNIYVGITIATFTFAEIGINIRGVCVHLKKDNMLGHALKMANLATSLIALVLTQTALLSFTHEGMADYDPSVANGLMGMLMGLVSSLLGGYMLIRLRKIEKKEKKDGTYIGG